MKDLGIEIINLHKKYDDVYAVKGIDLSIKKGEFYGLLGPNGAGKSTTINAITSLVKPTDGEVKIYDNTAASGDIKIHLKWGTAANEPLVMSFEGNGVRFETAAFVDVTNCDFVVAYYN